MIHWMEKDGILLIYLLFLSNLILEVPELWTFILCTVVKIMVSISTKEELNWKRFNSSKNNGLHLYKRRIELKEICLRGQIVIYLCFESNKNYNPEVDCRSIT